MNSELNSWNQDLLKDSCKFLGLESQLEFFDAKLEMMEIILESVHCQRIQVEVLSCFYKNIEDSFEYMRGLNQDVYKLLPRYEKTVCKAPFVLAIAERVIDNKGKRVQPICPQQDSHSIDRLHKFQKVDFQ